MRKRRRLLWQLYPWFLIISLISLTAMAWYATDLIRSHSVKATIEKLESQARLVEAMVKKRFAPEHASWLDSLCKELGPKVFGRVTVMMPSGKVLGDSEVDPNGTNYHTIRPEIRTALTGEVGTATRYSYTLNKEMVYVATPIKQDGRIVGVVRLSVPITEVGETLKTIYPDLLVVGLVITIVAAAMSLYASHRINKPIAALTEGAMEFAKGNLNYRLDVRGSEEVESLAKAMTGMAGQLLSRIETVTRQRNETEAVLSGMVEAVLVVDAKSKVVRMNKAAAKLLEIRVDDVEGRTIQEVIRNTDLHRFVSKALVAGEPVEDDIVIIGNPDRFLQAHGTRLADMRGRMIGALVVLNDVTRLKNVDNIRKEFVASVSHELKTPITSIKGFLETLSGGAIHDPENAQRFLEIIIKHTDRLSAIIEELLSLSRIEQRAERSEIELSEGPIRVVLQTITKNCGGKAQEKGIELKTHCEEGLTAHINSTLLEQALLNLVDNAIKFSERGSSVTVEAEKSGNEVVIKVADQGCGISREHHDRIFERFYRVDKARSREGGGTGLGLAIAKHIVNAHHGRIRLLSSPGRGSTFSIHLPAI